MPNYKGGDIALMADFDKYFHYKFQTNESAPKSRRDNFSL